MGGRWGSLAALLVVAIGIGVRLDLADRALGYDSANYAYVATRMAESGASYLDFFNNKPPAIYVWYRAVFGLFGNGPLACHLTSVLPDLGALLALSVLARRLAGVAVANVATALYASLPLAVRLSGEGYTESPIALLTLIAALLVVGGVRAPSAARGAAAGVLMGVAVLFKQPALLLAAGLAAWAASRMARENRGRWIAAYAAGLGVVGSMFLGWLAARGALGVFFERTFWQGMTRGYASGFDLGARLREELRWVFAPIPVTIVLGTAALLSRGARHTRGLAAALIVPLAAMSLLSYEFYDHYLLPALPPLCLVLAEWLVSLPSAAARGALAALLALSHGAGLMVFAAGWPSTDTRLEPWLATSRGRGISLGHQRRVADFVRSVTAPSEAILSTGSEIPYLAHRSNAYRFLGVAPYLGRLDPTGFSDFPAVAGRVRVLVLERWRLAMLPPTWVASLDEPGSPWHRVVPLYDPEIVVYARRDVAPTSGNP